MNTRSLKLICDVMVNSGKWTSLEISQDSIYLTFSDVELGSPKSGDDCSLTVRFAENSFFAAFFNNIWDVDFLSKYDYKNRLLSEEFVFDVIEFKFIDFEYLNTFFYNLKKDKIISIVDDFDIHNIRNDFFILVECEDIAIVAGGDQMDFFTPFERLDDGSFRVLCNECMLYFLNYHLKRNLIKDPMCENHPLMYTKK